MQLTVCGIGGAGCRIADRLVAAEATGPSSFLVDSVALDTDRETLAALTEIPDERQELYGAFAADGTGVDGDRERGEQCVADEKTALARVISESVRSQTDGILFCVGLGGASGSTAIPPLATELRRIHDCPIYAVGVLPADADSASKSERAGTSAATDMSAGSAATGTSTATDTSTETVDSAGHDDNTVPPTARWEANAGLAIDDLIAVTDSLFVFDNGLWLQSDETVTEPSVRRRLNSLLATRLAALFAAGEADHSQQVAESVVDASEIINTLDAGGIASIGYAVQSIERPTESRFGLGLFTQETNIDEITAIKAVETTVRRAVRGKLTVDIERNTVQRGLLIVGGPPEWLNRQAVADARAWLTEETESVEIRGGDMPDPDGDEITVVVLLAGVGDCRRVSALRNAADRANL